jgi:hypothetical protein
MAPTTPRSQVAALLREYGVGERFSIRRAARECGLSQETMCRLMRPEGDARRIRKSNLDKIADGLGIPRDVLERAMLADWGYTQAVSGVDLKDVLGQVRTFTPAELIALQTEIVRAQAAMLSRTTHA